MQNFKNNTKKYVKKCVFLFKFLNFFFGLILSYSSLLIIFVKKLKILLQIMRDNDDYKIKGKMKKFWRKKILFIRKQKQLKTIIILITCVELQTHNSLCYFWDDWWCTHDVKVSMKVLIKNLFFVWKKKMICSHHFTTNLLHLMGLLKIVHTAFIHLRKMSLN